MPATLVWGKGFRTEQTITSSGEGCAEVFGIDGDSEPISWSSVAEMKSTAARHGVSQELWPIYEEIELDRDIPLEDAVARSARLLDALATLSDEAICENYWLRVLLRLLRAGNSFFIMP